MKRPVEWSSDLACLVGYSPYSYTHSCPSPYLFPLLGSIPPRVPMLGWPSAHVQVLHPIQEMPRRQSTPGALDTTKPALNPLIWACGPNSNNNKRQHRGPRIDQQESQNFPSVTMALFTHSRDGRVLQSSEEKGIFDVVFFFSFLFSIWPKIDEIKS